MRKVALIALLAAGLMLGTGIMRNVTAQSDSSDTKTTLKMVEFSDYECPACGYYYPIVKKLKEKYGEQLDIHYKFFPLNSHRFSFLAARAAQAAKNQGKFLEMHNMLFSNQDQWSKSPNPAPTFVNYARELNLDIEQFKDELNARETQAAVIKQKNLGRKKGVRATPTFFIEGEQVSSLPKNFAEFDQLIKKYLQQKKNEG